MSRPIRIGLIAEGEAELGASVPYITPQEGGKPIEPAKEGALHTLIRRMLLEAGLPNCVFVHRHPTIHEQTLKILRGGTGILDRKYIAQSVIAWKPEEIDMVVLVVDADEEIEQRRRDLDRAMETVHKNHFDQTDQPHADRSLGGMAIKSFDTWLLADTHQVIDLLAISIPILPDDLESLSGDSKNEQSSKRILDQAIDQSNYEASHDHHRNRNLIIRWQITHLADLNRIRQRCQQGFVPFADSLQTIVSQIRNDLH